MFVCVLPASDSGLNLPPIKVYRNKKLSHFNLLAINSSFARKGCTCYLNPGFILLSRFYKKQEFFNSKNGK